MKRFAAILLILVLNLTANGQANRKILIEEFTGEWCGFCPEGHYIIKGLIATNPSKLVVTGMHYNDVFEIPYTLAMSQNLSVQGYPRAAIDRVNYSGGNAFVMSRSYWAGAVAARLNVSSPVSFSVNPTYNPTTRQLDISVDYTFLSAYNEETRITCLLVEDSLSSSQANYMNTTSGSPFFGLGNPILNYQQMHVTRVNLSTDVWGDQNHPAIVSAGQSFTKNYSYVLPLSMNPDRVRVVAFMNEKVGTIPVLGSGTEILNADEKPILPSSTSIPESQAKGEVSISPNPFYDLAAIRFTLGEAMKVRVYVSDMYGRLVKEIICENRLAGHHEVFWSGNNNQEIRMPEGVYLVNIETPVSRISRRVMLNR